MTDQGPRLPRGKVRSRPLDARHSRWAEPAVETPCVPEPAAPVRATHLPGQRCTRRADRLADGVRGRGDIERTFGVVVDNGHVSDHKVPLAAGGVILDERGQVLRIRENYGKRRYGLPGGRVDAGETPEQAVVRDVREETGLDVTPPH